MSAQCFHTCSLISVTHNAEVTLGEVACCSSWLNGFVLSILKVANSESSVSETTLAADNVQRMYDVGETLGSEVGGSLSE